MKNQYISALDKIRFRESQKEKLKSLFKEEKEKCEGQFCIMNDAQDVGTRMEEKNMRIKKIMKPVAVIAASLAVVVALNAAAPMLRHNGKSDHVEEKMAAGERKDKKGIGDYIDKYFSVTVYAKELTRTGKVYPDDYSAAGFNFGGSVDDDTAIDFAFEFPVECKGKNIDTVTYRIENGAFQVANEKGKSIVIEGEKLKKELNTPGRLPRGVDEVEEVQYRSFTIDYDHQKDEKTSICIVDTSEAWSTERKKAFKEAGYRYSTICSFKHIDLDACNFLVKDLGISCTVKYKDGTTETKKIKVSSEAVKCSELGWEWEGMGNDDSQMLVTCYRLG